LDHQRRTGLPHRKPDVPARHLVSYFVVIDEDQRRLLLVAHRKAGLMLPTGGHVEPIEHPWDAVRRECLEELGIDAVALEAFGERPLFATVTTTRGIGRHVDVSLRSAVRSEAASLASFVFVASCANSLLGLGKLLTTRFPVKHYCESALTSATWARTGISANRTISAPAREGHIRCGDSTRTHTPQAPWPR
jgi:ADP-ribose pyrophosphatase YjhB (NUDIX family)